MAVSLTLRNVLAASLVINIVVVAILAGFVYARLQSDWFYGSAEQFTPESAHEAARVMRSVRDDLQKEVRRLDKTRGELLGVLQADEFDQLDFEHHADDLKEINARILAKKLAATRSLAGKLPDEERIRLSVRMAQALGEPAREIMPWYKKMQAPVPEAKPE
jgi:uncharacterized membrane protein